MNEPSCLQQDNYDDYGIDYDDDNDEMMMMVITDDNDDDWWSQWPCYDNCLNDVPLNRLPLLSSLPNFSPVGSISDKKIHVTDLLQSVPIS